MSSPAAKTSTWPSRISRRPARTGEHFGGDKFDATMSKPWRWNSPTTCCINVTDKNYLAVVDKRTRTGVAKWPISEAQQNAPGRATAPTTASLSSLASPASCWCWTPQPALRSRVSRHRRTDEVVHTMRQTFRLYCGRRGYVEPFSSRTRIITWASRGYRARRAPNRHFSFRHYIGFMSAVSPGEATPGAVWFDVLPNGGLALSERTPHSGLRRAVRSRYAANSPVDGPG